VSNLEVIPLAFESLGVRSMATYVHTDDVNVVIDPAASLAPNRFGLPPHPLEEKTKNNLWATVKKRVEDADVLIVTHYHYDHIEPKEPEIYAGKTVLLKHPRRMINPSQKNRATSFIKSIKGVANDIKYADSRDYRFGGTEIRFSKPVPHGMTATRGYVVEVSIEAGETFLHTSDVQGPLLDEQVDFIIAERPRILFVDGPTTYIDSPFAQIELRKANENLVRIIREAGVNRMVVDHHLTRDLEYRRRIQTVLNVGEELGVSVGVAAEFLDVEPNLLEARRRELHGKAEG
jgi:predicted metallo-beta-lactamase superfamily hydrolase